MRLSIRVKQIIGVTAIVGSVVVGLSVLYATRLADVVVNESYSRGQMLAKQILHVAGGVVTAGIDPYAALRDDPNVRAILESSIYDENVLTAAIVDVNGIVIAHNIRSLVGTAVKPRKDLAALAEDTSFYKLRFLY